MTTKNQGKSRGGSKGKGPSKSGSKSSRPAASSASRRSNPTRGKANTYSKASTGEQTSPETRTNSRSRTASGSETRTRPNSSRSAAPRSSSYRGDEERSKFSRTAGPRSTGRGAPRRSGEVTLSTERGFHRDDEFQGGFDQHQDSYGRRTTKFRGKEKFPELSTPEPRPARKYTRKSADIGDENRAPDRRDSGFSDRPVRNPSGRREGSYTENSYSSGRTSGRSSGGRDSSSISYTSRGAVSRKPVRDRSKDREQIAIDNNSVYGRRAALEIIKYAPEKIDKIFVTETSAEWLSENVKKRTKLPIVNLRVSNTEFIASLRDEGINFTAPHQDDDKIIHQGIAVRLNCPQFLPGFKLLDDLDQVKTVLCTMDIFDPGNLGAIIRSAVALGIEHIAVCSSSRRDYARSTLGKASTGASEVVKLYGIKDIKSGLAKFKEAGFAICATDSGAKQNLSSFTVPDKSVILVGNEEKGLPDSIVSKCDHHVRVDLPGRIKSLNVAQATSILLWKWISCPKA